MHCVDGTIHPVQRKRGGVRPGENSQNSRKEIERIGGGRENVKHQLGGVGGTEYLGEESLGFSGGESSWGTSCSAMVMHLGRPRFSCCTWQDGVKTDMSVSTGTDSKGGASTLKRA